VKKVVLEEILEEREVALPELIIGSPTMEVWSLNMILRAMR